MKNKTYLFISENMYAFDSGNPSFKNPDTKNGIVVTNVEKHKGDQFCDGLFSYEYDGVKYITSYAWSLLENTPENVNLLKERNELRKQIKKLENKFKEKTEKMKFVA